jgi:hypothetical protein
MRAEVDNQACRICGDIPYDSQRRVLVVGTTRTAYCSQACLRVGVRTLQMARRGARLRRLLLLSSIFIAAAGVAYLRHFLMRHLAHRRVRVTVSTPAPVASPTPLEPIGFAPAWPPTDEEWQALLARANWVYPLPGPRRRGTVGTPELVPGAATVPPRCRAAGRCGVDLGGELWGEHVYAASDGVIERLQRNDDAPGGTSIHVAHFGGAVLTHYLHLAAIPTRLAVGARVAAGDVIGLVGDTGVKDTRARLRFALSVRPSSALPEVYWDPEPLMAQWPLRTPARGSVAGLTAADAPAEPVAGTPSVARAVTRRRR